jgi:predicted transcriptional regulator YheO
MIFGMLLSQLEEKTPESQIPVTLHIAQSLYNDPKNSIQEICRTPKISKVTLYRYIKTGERDR